jgi:phospholipid transport system substrate-binding protein
MSIRKSVLALALAMPLASAFPAFADTPEDAPVTALDSGLIGIMKAGSASQSFTQRAATLTPIVQQTFDLSTIIQNSVGLLWPTVPADQQAQLKDLFTKFTVASYVHEFASFGGQSFKLLPAEKALGSKKIVETQLVSSDGSATELDYVVSDNDGGWQITDVLLNGTISQVAIHASDFSGLVTQGDASQLITALKSKIAALSTDTVGQ